MKLALVADVHANREALAAVLAHAEAQGVDRHAFLGDYVGYGADPGWVVDRVRERVAGGAIAVQGNHDAAVAQGPQPSMVADARAVVAWTRARLDPAQLAFLAALPLTQVEGDALFVHANAWAPAGWAYVQTRREAVHSLHATDRLFTFCGHVHVPMLYHLASTGKVGDFKPSSGTPIPLSAHRRWLAIPGSVGQPRDGDPAASYAVFDSEGHVLTFHRVPYDHAAAAAKVRAAGLPERVAERLAGAG
jgi:diadenosine tetraphosphatase ApaH/serine/threonine PP2A family protein phosphatase